MTDIDVGFLKPFIEGARVTIKVQALTETKPGKPFFQGKGPEIDADIAAVIGVVSKSFSGTIMLVFPSAVFLGIMGRMLGDSYTEITTELEDGASELLNIIYGYAKRELNAGGFDIEKAIPSIIKGKSLSTRSLSTSPTVVLPFETDIGRFYIKISTETPSLE